jgi:hypothetical protein
MEEIIGMDKSDRDIQVRHGVSKEIADIFAKSGKLTQEEFDALRKNAKENVLDRFVAKIKRMEIDTPVKWTKILAEYVRNTNGKVSTLQDVIDHHSEFFKYYRESMETAEQLEFEIERAKKIFFAGGLNLNVVLEFDYQIYTEDHLHKKPTFYSYYNHKVVDLNGRRAFHIAIPATQSRLSDEEVEVVMKHEWGHIRQGHCTLKGQQFDTKYNNQGMDISINSGMTEEEKVLLFSAVRKMTNDPDAAPCMSLDGPTDKGGFNQATTIVPSAWRRAVGILKAYDTRFEDEDGGGGKRPPNKPPPKGPKPPPPKKPPEPQPPKVMQVGDYVYVKGTKNPQVFAQVVDIDEVTGKVIYEEFTNEEWENIKKAAG